MACSGEICSVGQYILYLDTETSQWSTRITWFSMPRPTPTVLLCKLFVQFGHFKGLIVVILKTEECETLISDTHWKPPFRIGILLICWQSPYSSLWFQFNLIAAVLNSTENIKCPLYLHSEYYLAQLMCFTIWIWSLGQNYDITVSAMCGKFY